MSRAIQAGEKFVYIVPIPLPARVLAAGVAIALFGIFFGIPLNDLGFARMVETLHSDAGMWAVLAGVNGALIAFFMVLAFPPQSWRARLTFEGNHVRFDPRPIFRWIDGPPVELAFGSRMQEILLCHGIRNDSPYGFRVILRAVNLPDREIKVETGNNLTFRECRALIAGIKTATGLPVLLVERIADKRGSAREIPWIPATRATQWIAAGKLGAAVLPVLGGMVIGLLRPENSVVVIVAIALWLVEAAGVIVMDHYSRQGPKLSASIWISSLFNFGFAYTIAFAFLSYLGNKK